MYDGKTAFVGHITLIKGVPFYGFHVGYSFFLKIYMLNPLHMTRLADLLRQGAIMSKALQPYESHLQYLLQWMCDYNLFGCGYIDSKVVRFRGPVPSHAELNSTTHRWHDQTIHQSRISDELQLPRQSHCSLEVDLCCQDILNRNEIKERSLHHDFVERKTPLPSDEKLVHSMAGLWRDETRRRKARLGQADESSTPFPPEVLVSVSADPRDSQKGGWIHEEEYREKLAEIAMDEKNKSDGRRLDFDSFVGKTPFEGRIKTSIESVKDLFPDNLQLISESRKNSQSARAADENPEDEEVEVDEKRAFSLEEDLFNYASDEDIVREMEMSQRRQKDHVEELYAEDGITENEHTSIVNGVNGRPDGNAIENVKVDPTRAADGPTSSGELAALGIRAAGDHTHVNQDAFEIPLEYGCDITGALKQDGRSKRPGSASGPGAKRRKMIHDERPQSRDQVEDVATVADTNDHSYPTNASTDFNTEDSHNSMDKQIDRRKDEGQTKHLTPPSSQESGRTRSVRGNRKLLYPVVKDPYNLDSVPKSSPNSHPTTNGSQKSKDKSVALEKSSGQSSNGWVTRRPSAPEFSFSSFASPSTQILQLSHKVHQAFGVIPQKSVLCFGLGPPTVADLVQERRYLKMPSVVYQKAHYSDERDAPDRAREYAGKEFRLESTTVPYLPDFDSTGLSAAKASSKLGVVLEKATEERIYQKRRRACSLRTWMIGRTPPSRAEVVRELQLHDDPLMKSHTPDTAGASRNIAKEEISQIDAVTQKNRHGFKYSQKQESTSVQHETQYMSIMSLEVHVNTRGNLVPNPEQDTIECIFWCIQTDDEDVVVNGINEGTHIGVLVFSENAGLAHKISQQYDVEIDEENSELDLMIRMVDIVRRHDPDILTGYEVHGGSWGFLIERARYKYEYNLCDEFSRMLSQSHGRFGKENDRWGFNHTSTIRVTGRHMINIWRAMRGSSTSFSTRWRMSSSTYCIGVSRTTHTKT